jgi:hypothetical protein
MTLSCSDLVMVVLLWERVQSDVVFLVLILRGSPKSARTSG